MPERVTFEQGERALASDLNAIGTKSEDGFLLLAQALIGNTGAAAGGNAIFNVNVDTTITFTAGPTVNAGEIFFAADGYVGHITGPFAAAFAADSDLYAVIERYVDSDTRVVASGAPPVEASVAVDVAVLEDMRYEVHPTATPPTPTLGGTVHYIRVAALMFVGPAKTFDPDGLLYTFPGDAIPVGAHAATHLPGGGDAIQVAALVGPNSTPGLLGTDELVTVREAITDITVSSPLSVTIAGDNTPGGTPKTADLGVTLGTNSGLKTAGGLGVVFGGSGSASLVARSDHKHTALQYSAWELPSTTAVGTLTSNTFSAGTFAGDQIQSVEVYYLKGAKRMLLSPNPGGGMGYNVIIDGSTVKILFYSTLMVVHAAVAAELDPSLPTTLTVSNSSGIRVVAIGEKSV